MPEKMRIQLRVRNHHIDWYGHVNNPQYLTFLEEARTDILLGSGCLGLRLLFSSLLSIFITP